MDTSTIARGERPTVRRVTLGCFRLCVPNTSAPGLLRCRGCRAMGHDEIVIGRLLAHARSRMEALGPGSLSREALEQCRVTYVARKPRRRAAQSTRPDAEGPGPRRPEP